MASLFNSKHNKYVSIPDWFKDVKPVEEQTIETKTTYISVGSGSSTPGLSNIAIYNKFVLKDAELDNAALTVKDIALNGIETELYKIGDEVPAIGWGTTEYVSVAGSSIITVISALLENDRGFGVIFYDNTLTIIGNVILQNSTEEITTPNNTYYFRISAPYNNTSFKVKYYKTETYNLEQLLLSNQNVTDYLSLNNLIPEGKNEITFSSNTLKLLVLPPLSLTKDINNIIKLSVDKIIQNQTNDLTIWGKLFDGNNNIDGDISNVGNISFLAAGKKIGEWGLGAELTYSNAIVSKGSGQSLWLVGSSYTDNNGIVFAKNDKGTRSDEIARINSIGFYPYITDSLSLGTIEKKWNNVYSKKTTIDDIELYQSQTNTLFVDGNLVVSGGITMYGTDGTTAPSIWDGAPKATTTDNADGKGIASFDSKFFSVSNGHVSFIGDVGGLDESALASYLSANKYLTQLTGDTRYLSITGNAATATNATNASNVYTNTSSVNFVFPVVFTSNYSKGNQTLFVDSASGAGYNPYSNTFTASYFNGDVNGNINIGGDTNYRIETFTNGLELNTYSLFRIMQSGTTRLYMDGNGNFGIKTSSPSSALHVAGSISVDSKIYVGDEVTIQGGTSNPYIHLVHGSKDWYLQCYNSSYMYIGAGSANSLRIDGSGNVLTPGGITMYSDLRKKTILNHVELSLKEVADAPLIEHYYNSDEAKTTHVGSVAQYWAGLNDWFCKEDSEGFLTMEIQNAALASAISVARELTRYESKTDKQINKLKKRIGELEEEIENLKNK